MHHAMNNICLFHLYMFLNKFVFIVEIKVKFTIPIIMELIEIIYGKGLHW